MRLVGARLVRCPIRRRCDMEPSTGVRGDHETISSARKLRAIVSARERVGYGSRSRHRYPIRKWLDLALYGVGCHALDSSVNARLDQAPDDFLAKPATERDAFRLLETAGYDVSGIAMAVRLELGTVDGADRCEMVDVVRVEALNVVKDDTVRDWTEGMDAHVVTSLECRSSGRPRST